MGSPKAVGEASEAMTIAKFLIAGLPVLKPFGDNQRYDLVVENDGEFFRVQCKTGRVKNGAVRFSTCSTYAHRGRKRRDYRGQIELFAVYEPALDKLYLVPVDAVGRVEGSLRIEAAKNGQKKNVKLANDYEFTGSFLP